MNNNENINHDAQQEEVLFPSNPEEVDQLTHTEEELKQYDGLVEDEFEDDEHERIHADDMERDDTPFLTEDNLWEDMHDTSDW